MFYWNVMIQQLPWSVLCVCLFGFITWQPPYTVLQYFIAINIESFTQVSIKTFAMRLCNVSLFIFLGIFCISIRSLGGEFVIGIYCVRQSKLVSSLFWRPGWYHKWENYFLKLHEFCFVTKCHLKCSTLLHFLENGPVLWEYLDNAFDRNWIPYP